VLWIVVVASLVSLGLAARGARSAEARMGWLVALAALVSALLATRLGPRVLFVAAPTLIWMVWRWLQVRAVGGREPSEPRPRGTMTRQEALRVLGLREGASEEAITNAYRNLIKKVHPDHGGSDLLAQQVNEAKRVLESS
jgi:DnaJ-domain-containing protein 1